jgi:cell division protein FtsQ
MTQRRRQPMKRSRKGFDFARIPPGILRLGGVLALALVVLGGVLGGLAMLNDPENLPISQIDIQGELKYIKDEELRAVIDKYTHTNLYLLDVDALEADLETQPWVRAITIRKSWPDQLIVVVEEQYPYAFWGKDRLMNKYGELFTAELPAMRGILPTLYSPEDKGREMAESFKKLHQALADLPLEISEFSEDESGAWRMKIKEGPEVLIGNDDQDRRLLRFKVGFQRELVHKLGNVRRVDLRYTNGFAVEWKQSPIGSRDTTDASRGV